MQVVNVVAPMLLGESKIFRGAQPSNFSRLRHLTLMLDLRGCFMDTMSQLSTAVAEIGHHSQLQSLYIGFVSGFGGMRTDPEDSIDLYLSHLQHLKSVHLDSFWPALLELPPRASLHATFKPAAGQKHPGLWAGRPADVQNSQLRLRSMQFLLHARLAEPDAMTAKELWPLRVKCSDLFRMMAGPVHLHDLPGGIALMQAERVLITASKCDMCIPGNQVAFKQLEIRVSEQLKLSITDVAAFAARVETLTIICTRPMDFRALSAALRSTMLAAGKTLDTTCCRTLCQPEGWKEPWRLDQGDANLGVGSETMKVGEWAHAMRCCCHACLACLHRDGAAAFPEAIAEERAMFGV